MATRFGMIALVLAALPAQVWGSPVYITFSGQIVSTPTISGISSGDSYFGSLVYDSSDPLDQLLTQPEYNFYDFQTNDVLSVTIGACTFSGSGPRDGFSNNVTVDTQNVVYPVSFDAHVIPASTCQGLGIPFSVDFTLQGLSGLLSTSGLPSASDFNLNSLAISWLTVDFVGGPYSMLESASGINTSIQVSSTPEPPIGYVSPLLMIVVVLVHTRRRARSVDLYQTVGASQA